MLRDADDSGLRPASDRTGRNYRPHVVVKLRSAGTGGSLLMAPANDVGAAIRAALPGAAVDPLFPAPAALPGMLPGAPPGVMDLAVESGPSRDALTYLRIGVPPGLDPQEAVSRLEPL